MSFLPCLLLAIHSFTHSPRQDGVTWVNPPAAHRVMEHGGGYDPSIETPALRRGAVTQGDTELSFEQKGRHFVEVFLVADAAEKTSFVLEVGGAVADRRFEASPLPDRLRPRRGAKRVDLLAWVEGPAKLTVRAHAKQYLLSAVRWTPAAEFETKLVPEWRARARWLQSNGLYEYRHENPMSRPNYLRQLHDRLRFSADPAVRREATIGLTRAFYWVAAENHEPPEIARTGALIEECLRIAPDDPIVRQMASASCTASNSSGAMAKGAFCTTVAAVPWDAKIPPAPPGAPDWAVSQRAIKRRMDAITRWWVEERQQPNGELGGAWGDDVEILRHWGPLAIGLGSEVAARGLQRIADGLWSSGRLVNGYDKDISDVEHSSEPTTDTQPLLAALRPDDAAVVARLGETAACAENWIGRQRDGFFRFHTSWFNCRARDRSAERAVDVHLNVRAMGPALWYAYLTRDAKLAKLLANWAESWLTAMRNTGHGKPAGMIPPAMRAADGNYLIASDRWDKPNAEWDYFQWSERSQEAIVSLFEAVHDLTGDAKWRAAAAEGKRAARLEDPAVPDAAALTRMAREMDRHLGINFDMMTREVLYTDRVYYRFDPAYQIALFGGEPPRGERYPRFAVTWEPSAVEYARMVTQASGNALSMRLYSFEAVAAKAVLRAWRVAPGAYRWKIRETGEQGVMRVEKLPARVEIPMAPRRELNVDLGPA